MSIVDGYPFRKDYVFANSKTANDSVNRGYLCFPSDIQTNVQGIKRIPFLFNPLPIEETISNQIDIKRIPGRPIPLYNYIGGNSHDLKFTLHVVDFRIPLAKEIDSNLDTCKKYVDAIKKLEYPYPEISKKTPSLPLVQVLLSDPSLMWYGYVNSCNIKYEDIKLKSAGEFYVSYATVDLDFLLVEKDETKGAVVWTTVPKIVTEFAADSYSKDPTDKNFLITKKKSEPDRLKEDLNVPQEIIIVEPPKETLEYTLDLNSLKNKKYIDEIKITTKFYPANVNIGEGEMMKQDLSSWKYNYLTEQQKAQYRAENVEYRNKHAELTKSFKETNIKITTVYEDWRFIRKDANYSYYQYTPKEDIKTAKSYYKFTINNSGQDTIIHSRITKELAEGK